MADEQALRGRVAKRQAILRAARQVFAGEGYTRAGIETIAAQAGVSTRTIYNHFDSKQNLFTVLIQDSSAQIVDLLRDVIDRHLGSVGTPQELEPALIALAHDWARPQTEFADHFAIVGHLNAEAAHLPPKILTAWKAAGPWKAGTELARHLRRLSADGLLDLGAPLTDAQAAAVATGPEAGHRMDAAARAAEHFLLLTTVAIANRSYHSAVALDQAQTAILITTGVRAFLNGHRPRNDHS
jgi:AcrR family transcriptional regulator